MIHVDKFAEAIDTDKNTAKKGFEAIMPKEALSDSEANAFILKEFEKAREDAAPSVQERLFIEVFDRSEEELDIHFDIDDRVKTILDNFSEEKWNSMNDAEKRSVIKELIKVVGERLGLDKLPSVKLFADEEAALGVFDSEKNEIRLNKSFFEDVKEVVNTAMHELRHAYQHMRAELAQTWEDVIYQFNFDNYISPIPLPGGGFLMFYDYYNQYVEVDARVFADKFSEAM